MAIACEACRRLLQDAQAAIDPSARPARPGRRDQRRRPNLEADGARPVPSSSAPPAKRVARDHFDRLDQVVSRIARAVTTFCIPSASSPVPGMTAANLGRLTMPTLILRSGRSDMSHTRRTTEWVHELIPPSRLAEPPWPDQECNTCAAASQAARAGLFVGWPALTPIRLDSRRPPERGRMRGNSISRESTRMAQFDRNSTTDEILAGVDLSGKRILVTGISSGLGAETARALTAHGAEVVGTARDLDKARQAAPGCQVFTADGFDLQFGTHHLGHLLLVNRIAPLLRSGGRLICLSSQGHRMADVDLDDPNFERTPYVEFIAYGRSRTGNALFAAGLDRRHRHRGVRAASLHPGAIRTPLMKYMTRELMTQLTTLAFREKPPADQPPPSLKSVEQGAATSVWAVCVAASDEIGGRYCEDCAGAPVVGEPEMRGVRSYALDPARAEALWVLSEQMVGEAA